MIDLKTLVPKPFHVFLTRQTVLFLIAGIINTILSFAAFSFCVIYLDLDYRLAALASLLVGMSAGFLQSRYGVFRSKNSTSLVRYFAVLTVLYFISIWALGLLIGVGVSKIQAYLITIILLVPFSFLIQKFWVFKDSR